MLLATGAGGDPDRLGAIAEPQPSQDLRHPTRRANPQRDSIDAADADGAQPHPDAAHL